MSRAGAWVLASSLVFLSAGSAAQPQSSTEQRPGGATAPSSTPGLGSRSGGTGRDQFIAPVMGIQIQGDGLNLPEAEEEDPAKPAAKPPAESRPETKSGEIETKQQEPRSTRQ
jgi:hypothetical protein